MLISDDDTLEWRVSSRKNEPGWVVRPPRLRRGRAARGAWIVVCIRAPGEGGWEGGSDKWGKRSAAVYVPEKGGGISSKYLGSC